MMRTAVIFTGQGSQFPGMIQTIAERPETADVFGVAAEALGFDLARLCLEGPADELTLTANAQPAILATSIALWRWVRAETAWKPDFVAGHSLGEYSALVAASALDLRDALVLVHQRGRLMQAAVPPGVGAMAAVIGLADAIVIETCLQVERPGHIVRPANFNAPGQVVIAGHRVAVQEASDILKAKKARILPLHVSAPFHTPLMAPAEDRMAEILDQVAWKALQIPWVDNVSAHVVTLVEDARKTLKKQITAPVQWTRLVRRLADGGVTRFVEIGPKPVLSGLVRRIFPEAERQTITDADSLAAFLDRPKDVL